MSSTELTSRSPEQTLEMGRELASRIQSPMLVLLSGELGSGKTTFTKGLISGLGAAREEEVTSPTFTLVHVFQNANREKVYHVDLYRVEGRRDLETLALEDALSEPGVVIIEWSEHFALRSDWPRIAIRFEHVQGDTRRVIITECPVEAARH